tara:strand:- start:4035 stop:4643 length:609 start_codon:yes stop_codon:yes gene_type:complete
MNYLKKSIQDSLKLKKKLQAFEGHINGFSQKVCDTILNNNKIFICGNGGSAADAQHLAAEFLVRLNPNKNRPSLPMIPLALDTSSLTACGNDYSFEKIFSRNLEGLGNKNDLLICISTSGNSKNIINVIKVALKKKIDVLCFLGKGGGAVKKIIKDKKKMIVVPSRDTARIQECHIFLGHVILNIAETLLIKKKFVKNKNFL